MFSAFSQSKPVKRFPKSLRISKHCRKRSSPSPGLHVAHARSLRVDKQQQKQEVINYFYQSLKYTAAA